MSISKNKLLEIKIKKRLNLDFLGAYKTFLRGSGLIFSDLRNYIIGDSIKSIDWKTSAKQNDIYIKNYEEQREIKTLFVLDLTKSMYFGSSEKTKKDLLLEIFFLLSFSCINAGQKIGIILFDEQKFEFIDFKSGEINLISLEKKIETFAKNNAKTENRNIEIIKKINSLSLKNNLVFFLSDKFEIDNNLFKLFAYRNEFIYIHIFDYFENNLTNQKGNINLGFTNSFLNIDLSDDLKIEKFKILRKNKISDFKKKLFKLNIKYIYLDTQSDIFKEFYNFFKKSNI